MIELRARFSAELRRGLKSRYGRLPAVEVVARDFEGIVDGRYKVTRESFRRWMTGVSFPEVERFAALVDWLGLDVEEIFVNRSCRTVAEPGDGPAREQ